MFPGDLIYNQADNEDQLTHTLIAKLVGVVAQFLGGNIWSVTGWEQLVSYWVGIPGQLLGVNTWSVTELSFIVQSLGM